MKRSFIIAPLLVVLLFNYRNSPGQKISSECFYTNPVGEKILMGDPYILLHNGTYYLYGTTSSGEGFKCWSSKDFREWKPEGFVYQKKEESWGGSNFWAPEVYFYNNEFYMAYSCKGKDKTDDKMLPCLAKSDSPTGPFKDVYAPWFDMGFSCIDAHLFFDDDKRIYLYFDRVGYEGKWPDGYLYGLIYCMETDENLKPVSDTVFCSKAEQDWEHPQSKNSRCNEGSSVLKHNGIYYMTYSANHYLDPFYGVGYSTAPTPLGPWKKSTENPLIGMNKQAGILGPGHNSFTTSPDGKELFIVYHTHISEENKQRQVNIDRIRFDDDGKLNVNGPTRRPQKVPSGVKNQ